MERRVRFSDIHDVKEIEEHKHAYAAMCLQDPRKKKEMDRVHTETMQEHLHARKMVTVLYYLEVSGIRLENRTVANNEEWIVQLAVELGWDQVVPEVEADEPEAEEADVSEDEEAEDEEAETDKI